MGLSNEDFTPDFGEFIRLDGNKYYTKVETDALLEGKADVTTVEQVIGELENKANIQEVNAALSLKADTAFVNSALASKADTATVNAAISSVGTVLATKADTNTVNTALNLKVDKIAGKSLSTNDLTDDRLASIQSADSACKKYKSLKQIVIGAVNGGYTAEDCDYLCDGNNDASQIQTALDSLTKGGTVIFLPGTYYVNEPTIRYSNITIKGYQSKTFFQVTNQNCFKINANYTCIQGITFKQTGTANGESVIKNENSIMDLNIYDCTFDINQCYMETIFGIYGSVINLHDVNGFQIQSCIFSVGKCLNILYFANNQNTRIYQNIFTATRSDNTMNGIQFEGVMQNTNVSVNVFNNLYQVVNCGNGFGTFWQHRLLMVDNIIAQTQNVSSNGNGIRLRATYATVRNNIFAETRYNTALIIEAGNNIVLSGNNVTNGSNCYQIGDNTDVHEMTITDNIGQCTNSGFKAIYLIGATQRNLVVGNRFIGNVVNDGTNNLVENNLITSV